MAACFEKWRSWKGALEMVNLPLKKINLITYTLINLFPLFTVKVGDCKYGNYPKAT